MWTSMDIIFKYECMHVCMCFFKTFILKYVGILSENIANERYVCVHVCVCMCICMYVCMNVCVVCIIHVCMHVYCYLFHSLTPITRAFMYVMYVSMYVCNVCMYVCM